MHLYWWLHTFDYFPNFWKAIIIKDIDNKDGWDFLIIAVILIITWFFY